MFVCVCMCALGCMRVNKYNQDCRPNRCTTIKYNKSVLFVCAIAIAHKAHTIPTKMKLYTSQQENETNREKNSVINYTFIRARTHTQRLAHSGKRIIYIHMEQMLVSDLRKYTESAILEDLRSVS